MPHGIFVDKNNYYYTTDVGAHQIIKWKIDNGEKKKIDFFFVSQLFLFIFFFLGELKPILKLGELFVPGNDHFHFCMPTSVAVSTIDNNIYISDGYCNSRIIKFSNNGKFITQWGHQSYNREREYLKGNFQLGYFLIPHDISLNEREEKVIVSDRENGRIQVFTNNGTPLYDIKDFKLYQTVYSAYYCEG